MKNKFIKQVLVGVIGLLLSIGFLIFYYITFDTSNIWINYVISAIAFSCFMGSLLSIFGGRSMFLFGGKLGLVLVAFMVIIKELPNPWNGFFIVICIVILLAVPIVKEYLFDREKNSITPKNKKISRIIKEEEAIEKELETEKKAFLSKIGFGDKSLILLSSSGRFYQCIKGYNKFYFIYLGNEIMGINYNDIKTDFSIEEQYIRKKKDYVIDKNSIHSIKYKEINTEESILYYYSKIIIKYGHKKKRFKLLDPISIEKISLFFNNLNINVKLKKKEQDESINNEKDNNLFRKLKQTFMIINVISIVISASFLFFIIHYKALSILSMLLFILSYILYIKYNDYISIADDKNQETFTKNKINISFTFLFPCIVLGLRSVLDFQLLSYKMLWIWSLLIFLILIYLFFKFTYEFKRKKSTILVIVMAALIFAPSSVVQTNYIFDYSKPTIIETEILEMRVSENSKSPDKYLVKVEIPNGKLMELNISKEYFNELSIGDKINVVEKEGLLKISYVFVKED